MIINDLEQIEVVSNEENSVVGGVAFADASASAYANGRFFAATSTRTYTSAYDTSFFFGPSSSSNSSSSSTAD